MSAERDARKRSLEERIASIKRIEKLCGEIMQNLDKELQLIEDEEADEDEAAWAKRWRTA